MTLYKQRAREHFAARIRGLGLPSAIVQSMLPQKLQGVRIRTGSLNLTTRRRTLADITFENAEHRDRVEGILESYGFPLLRFQDAFGQPGITVCPRPGGLDTPCDGEVSAALWDGVPE